MFNYFFYKVLRTFSLCTVLLIFSCSNSDNKKTTYESVNHYTNVLNIINEVDRSANINFRFDNSLNLLTIEINNVSLNDSKKFANILFDFIFLSLNQKYPEFSGWIQVELNFVRGIKYSSMSSKSCFDNQTINDLEYVNHLKNILLTFTAEDVAYYDLVMPSVRDVYPLLACNISFPDLLIILYNKEALKPSCKLLILTFYNISDIPYNELKFNKSGLRDILELNGFDMTFWTSQEIQNLYLIENNVDSIITSSGNIHYYRGMLD